MYPFRRRQSQMGQPRTTTITKIVPIQAQAVPDGTTKDSHYYKTLMAGMKKDFEAELEKVKGHFLKEKSR
ncbi:hypothetical protein DPMN_186775 [Dreissena polymorpha]|uniref:Uncharacterized protein n=1 Tax=Dreissena polymorpha TaxID=45954 RepID=A0A9D4DNG0_DREPO|nr:hypothetical protein DPMN_186775 [Dreissena polymorpha]